MMTSKCGFAMSPTAISVAVRDEIQRFESVHPSIYAIHDLIEDIDNPAIQQQLKDHILSIEDAFVNSQEWTLSRSVQDLKLGVLGTFNSGKAPLVHHYLTGSYLNEESFEGGRFKKEVVTESQSYLLLIREEGGPPDMQFSQWVDAAMFVYNVTSESSFNTIYTYYAKMSLYRHMQELPIFLVASCDGITSNTPRLVSELKGRKMAADLKNCHYIEVCSENGHNVNEAFYEACQKILTMRQQQQQWNGAATSSHVTLTKPLQALPPNHASQPPSVFCDPYLNLNNQAVPCASLPDSFSISSTANNGSNFNIPLADHPSRRLSKPFLEKNGAVTPLENGCSEMSSSLHSKLPCSYDQAPLPHNSKLALNHSVQNPNFVSVSPNNTPSFQRKFDSFAKNTFKSSSFHDSHLQHRGSQLSLQIDMSELPSARTKRGKTGKSFAERIDSFLKEFPMSKDKLNKGSSALGNLPRHRSYSIQSIEQAEDDEATKDGPTPTTTPTPGRKNNRRKSNIFTGRKDGEDKKLKNGDTKLGVGRVIPIKQGWLYKRSNKPLSKDWQKKYVTLLDDGRLTYHSSLNDYMENCHGKEIKLGQTTVKIPGQRPRGSEISKASLSTHVSRQSDVNLSSPSYRGSFSTTSSSGSTARMTDSIVIPNSGVLNSMPSSGSHPIKLETPIAKKKHRRIKSNSRILDGSDDTEGGFEFVIVSLDNKQWHFEASSFEEREDWVTAVEHQICSSLQLNRSSKAPTASSLNLTVISKIRSVPGNNACADCGALNPEWASLNLGALICIECSGIHRNLGTHLSRVRSLELDEWPSNLVSVMTSIGNKVLNNVWEANAIGCRKPMVTSSREEKDKWIRTKYELKNYLPPLPFEGIPIYQQLMDAVARNDVQSTILVLAYCTPAEVNRPHSCVDTRTALHIAAAVGSVVLVQLLLWYGANPDLLDHENHNAAFYAKNHRAFECLKILESQKHQ